MLRTTTTLLAALTLVACTEEGAMHMIVAPDTDDTSRAEADAARDGADVADVEALPETKPDAAIVQDVT